MSPNSVLIYAFLTTSFMILAVFPQPQPLVVPNPITPGQPFTVYCDASHVTIPYYVNQINSLVIIRNVPSNDSDTQVAIYCSRSAPCYQTFQIKPPERDWIFIYTGDTGSGWSSGNRNSMKIVWKVTDTTDEDAGLYYCQVHYLDPNYNNIVMAQAMLNVTATGQPQQLTPITNVNQVLEGETLSITCDANRVPIPQSEDPPTSISELIIEARLGSSQKFVKLAQYSACGPQGRLQYQNVLPGRDWTFNFTGSNSGQNNLLTMRVEIHVRDAAYIDAGSFKCTVRYFSSLGGVDEVSQVQNVSPGVPLPIASEDNLTNNGSIKITCDAHRIPLSDPDVNIANVGALMIEARDNTSQTFTKIAEYLACGPQENLQFQDPPAGSDWDFTFSGSNNGTHNRNTMKIEVLIPDGSCSYIVTYRCSAMFYAIDEGTVWLHKDQDVTVAC
jgi:hypothetical protein